VKNRTAYKIIREELIDAVKEEEAIEPFNLWGRGHEPRVKLDRQLAAILRGLNLPRVEISGYGANYYYPKRIFTTAQKRLNKRIEKSRFQLEFGNYGNSAFLSDKWFRI
jgi:flavodoxin